MACNSKMVGHNANRVNKISVTLLTHIRGVLVYPCSVQGHLGAFPAFVSKCPLTQRLKLKENCGSGLGGGVPRIWVYIFDLIVCQCHCGVIKCICLKIDIWHISTAGVDHQGPTLSDFPIFRKRRFKTLQFSSNFVLYFI